MTPNQHEFAKLTPERKPASLLKKGVGCVIVTQGRDGVQLATAEGEVRDVKAVPATVVDTTGAGDAFNAGLVVGLAEGASLAEAVSLGMQNGAYAVTQAGVLDGLATREQLDQSSVALR